MQYGPQVIKSNLVLLLDAADRNSYSGSGTLWKDLSGNNAHFTLGCAGSGCVNPSFGNNAFQTNYTASTANWASYLNGNSVIKDLLYSNHTIEVSCKINSFAVGSSLNAAYTNENQTSLVIWKGTHAGLYLESAGACTYSIWNASVGTISLSTPLSSYVGRNIMIHSVRISDTLYLYVNGQLATSAVRTPTTYRAYTDVAIGAAKTTNIVSDNTYSWPSNVDFYSVKLYTMGFAQPQVTQNFNAIRGRLGI